MKIAFLVNSMVGAKPSSTTTDLALAAHRRGHEIWLIGAEGLSYGVEGAVYAQAWPASGQPSWTVSSFREAAGTDSEIQQICVADLDVLMLRSDPSRDAVQRPWAQNVGILFGQAAASAGVVVLNDPPGAELASDLDLKSRRLLPHRCFNNRSGSKLPIAHLTLRRRAGTRGLSAPARRETL